LVLEEAAQGRADALAVAVTRAEQILGGTSELSQKGRPKPRPVGPHLVARTGPIPRPNPARDYVVAFALP